MMDIVALIIAICTGIALWAHGYTTGELKGFRKGCNLWRPEYYRIYHTYLQSCKSLYENIESHCTTDEVRTAARAAIDRLDKELIDLITVEGKGQ